MSEISISAGQLPINYAGGETDLKMRIYCRRQFITSDSELVARGALHTSDFYQEVDCDVSGMTISHDAFTIHSTEDGTPASSWYLFAIYTAAGAYVGTAYKKIRIPASPSTRTLASLAVYNNAVCDDLPNTYYTAAMIDELLDDLVNAATKATELVYGVSKLSFPAASVEAPIVVGHNDPIWRSFRKSYYLEDYGYDAAGVEAFLTEVGTTTFVELVIADMLTISDTGWDATFSKNILVRFIGNDSGITITSSDSFINIDSPTVGLSNRQYFFGAGQVIFFNNAVPWMNLSWWAGIRPTGGNNSHAFAQFVSSMNAQNSGGGIGYVGGGTWFVDNQTLPRYGKIIGAGNDPDGVRGTVFKAFTTNPSCVLRLDAGNRMTTLEKLNVSQRGTTGSTVGFLAEGPSFAASGFHFRATDCGFQGLDNATAGAIEFQRSATDDWETIGNYFDHCWIQGGQNQRAVQISTVNSSFTWNTCSVQISAGGTAFWADRRGWWVEINTDARGAAPITSQPFTANRNIAQASVSRTAGDLENAFYSTIVLNAATPSADRFKANDILAPVSWSGGGGFPGTPYIVDLVDEFTARLSEYPSSPLTNQPCTINRWGDEVGPAHAVRHFDGGNMNHTKVIGGQDEGFRYSLIYGGSPTAWVEFTNYESQGRFKFISSTNFYGTGTFGSATFFDESSGPVVNVAFGPSTHFHTSHGRNLFTKQAYIWGKRAMTDDEVFTRMLFDQSILTYAENDLTTIRYSNVNRHYRGLEVFDHGGIPGLATAELAPSFAVSTWKARTGGGDTQKRMFRGGKKNIHFNTWQDYYDHYYNQNTKSWDILSNRAENVDPNNDDASLRLVNMPLRTKQVRIDTFERQNQQGGLNYTIDVCDDVTQLTSNTTAVTVNALGGAVSMVSASVAAGDRVKFRINNNKFTNFKCIPVVSVHNNSGGEFNAWVCDASGDPDNIATGRWFDVIVKNESASSSNTNIIIKFAIVGITW